MIIQWMPIFIFNVTIKNSHIVKYLNVYHQITSVYPIRCQERSKTKPDAGWGVKGPLMLYFIFIKIGGKLMVKKFIYSGLLVLIMRKNLC